MTNYHVNKNELDKALKELALRFAPRQIAKCGDVVTAEWCGWKQPHKCKITMIWLEIAPIDLTIKARQDKSIDGWMMTQYEYFGRRLKANGEMAGNPATGFLLTKFTTDDGQIYERLLAGFNHAGMSFDIEALVDYHNWNKMEA